MKQGKSRASEKASGKEPSAQASTLGEYAHQIIDIQYHSIIKQEKLVLADKDPEHLHDMRVGIRRLRTALQIFDRAIELPKAASIKRLSSIAKTLGNLRDLDVQIADIQNNYRPQIPESEQTLLDKVLGNLQQQRRKAFADTEEMLGRSPYRNLKIAYETWLEQPSYTLLGQLPLAPLLPDLLSPLLASLLLHPGWLVQTADPSEAANQTLHDLRKACKHARYQAEFFISFYGQPFQDWLEEVRKIQGMLGKVQDSQVLLQLLAEHLPKRSNLSGLQTVIQQNQVEAMLGWEDIQQRYLDPNHRQQLRHLVLEPGLTQGAQPTKAKKSTKATSKIPPA